jgi:beta-lactamase regulating signal transducer with metallopeptidase domain
MSLNETMLGSWWLHSAIGGGLLLLLAGVLMALTRQPARRQRLGEWGVTAALIVALLSVAPAWLLVPLPGGYQPKPQAAAPVAVVAEPPAPGPANHPAPEAPAWTPDTSVSALDIPPHEASAEESLAVTQPNPAVNSSPESPPGFTVTTLCHWLGIAYLVVAGIFLLRWLWQYVRLWRLLRAARPAPLSVERLFREMAFGLSPAPRLLVADQLHIPISCGLLRPTVLLPAELAQHANETALRWVFAHELTHLRRRDAWACVLFGLAQAVYFYLPWFWPLRRQVRLCQEYVADAAAVEQGAAPEDYAEFLLSLVALPAPPAAATSVLGHSSDLFRRVTMLLKTSSLEKRCPRFWSLAVAASLLSGAVLLSGLGLKAAPVPVPKDEPKKEDPKKDDAKKDEPKKDEPKKDDNPLIPGIPDLKDLLPPDLPPEVAEQFKKQMEQIDQMMKRMQQQGGGIWINPGMNGGAWGGGFGLPGRHDAVKARMGALVKSPDATLVEQLDLPKNQGLVIGEVKADSPAAKAGLKANDILLELNGKPVTNEPKDLAKMLDDIKPNTPVDAVVLRKGKKETVKGLSMPEAPKPANPFGAPGAFPGLPGNLFPGGGAPGASTMSMTRTNDGFTTTYNEGALTIVVSGKIDDGKAKVEDIRITDSGETKSYKSVDDVPANLRDDVKHIIRKSEAGPRSTEKKID